MLKTYTELKQENQNKINNFPIFYAFNDEQLKQGLEKLNTTIENITSIGYGGFIRKSDKEAFKNMFDDIEQEQKELMKDDDFVIDMFLYEMGNHEYCITYDKEEVLNACDISKIEYKENVRLQKLFNKAHEQYFERIEKSKIDWVVEQLTSENLIEIVENINSWNGDLENYEVYTFDENFFNTYYLNNPMEAARAATFGKLNWSDEYIRFDGYGNLESLSSGDYENLLVENAEEIVEKAIDLYEENKISLSYEIESVFDEHLENC